MPVNRLQSHHTAMDTSRASGARAFVGFDVPLPRAGAKPPEIVRAMLHHIGMTDADIARFSKQNGYDLVDYSVTSMQKYGGFQTASVHVTREHPQGVARVEIPRADYDALRHFINGSATNAAPGSTARSARAGGEAYAAHRGINTAAQMRAQLDARLPAGKTSAPQVASSSPANSVAQTKPVAQMTTTEKLQFAVERAAAHLGPEAAEKLRALVTPENLAIMAGTTVALIAVQGVPGLDVLVDAGIAGVAVYSLGTEAIGVIKDLAGFASGVMNAKTESDLDAAGQHMARAVSTVGVDTVAALLLHKAGGAIKENLPKSPAMREMVTPEGVRIRVPVEESPAAHNTNKMSAKGNVKSSSVSKTTVSETTKVKNADSAAHVEYRGVEITDAKGNPIGEFDRIEGNLFVEEKSAQGLKVKNPKTNRPFQTPEDWARKQIFDKTVVRIANLAKAAKTRATAGGSKATPSLSDIQKMRHLEFRIESTTPEVRTAVATQVRALQNKYPDWTFSVKYGS